MSEIAVTGNQSGGAAPVEGTGAESVAEGLLARIEAGAVALERRVAAADLTQPEAVQGLLNDLGVAQRVAAVAGLDRAAARISVAKDKLLEILGESVPRGAGRPKKTSPRATIPKVLNRAVRDHRSEWGDTSPERREEVRAECVERGEPLTRERRRKERRAAAGGSGRVENAGSETAQARDVVLIPPVQVLDAARQALDVEEFDLAPASCEVVNRFVGAKCCLGPERGVSEPWRPPGAPDDWAGTLWVHPPPGREEPFAERLLQLFDSNWGGTAVWLSDAATSARWAQHVMMNAWVVAFPAGEVPFHDGAATVTPRMRRRDRQMMLVMGTMDGEGCARAFHALRSLGTVMAIEEDPDDETGEDPDAG